ncbi:3-phosphoserine phosphatase [Artemisia annua]|uniref:phosphoserine phosphatase n=1 Tax=Artemisia annua TaxID=35608 RepID=A0A2U1LUD8_ARTAN|nr:3-phosphoserine phosphatase [Artemisia annua]
MSANATICIIIAALSLNFNLLSQNLTRSPIKFFNDPVASILGVLAENLFANQLLFDISGEFVGFDVNEPTLRNGGKPTAIELLRKTHGYKTIVMIGDGATDLEARKPGCVDLFICYGGVQLREAVSTKANWLGMLFAKPKRR